MSTGLQARILGPDTHANRPATPPSPTLYSCTTHSALERYTTSGGWEDWVVVGVTGESWQGSWSAGTYTTGEIVEHNDVIYQANTTTTDEPPGTDWDVLYTAPGGSNTPLLLVDAMTLDASGSDFDVDMSDWTTGGSPSASSVITTEPYDASTIDLTFGAQSDRYYKAIDAAFAAGTKAYYLTIHGISNSTPSPATALGGMLALAVVDNSGNGTGVSLYNDNNGYLWSVASNAYSATGNMVVSTWPQIVPAAGTSWPIMYRLSTNGSTTVTGAVSFNGGANWLTNTRSDSTTWTRIMLVRLFNGGGTNPKFRAGRFNLA